MPLMTERQIGMAAGPIPESKIWAHAERLGITDLDDLDDFVAWIRAMESEFRDWEKAKDEKPEES